MGAPLAENFTRLLNEEDKKIVSPVSPNDVFRNVLATQKMLSIAKEAHKKATQEAIALLHTYSVNGNPASHAVDGYRFRIKRTSRRGWDQEKVAEAIKECPSISNRVTTSISSADYQALSKRERTALSGAMRVNESETISIAKE